MSFGILAKQVLSLDAAIEWMVLEEAGREPRWAWRNPRDGNLRMRFSRDYAQVVDPLLFMVADGDGGPKNGEAIGNAHRVRFVVLAYADMAQVVARLPNGHITAAISPETDAYAVGRKLAGLLDRCMQRPVLH